MVEEAEPLRPFIPPVTQELSVIQGTDHAGRTPLGLVATQHPGHSGREMARVFPRPFLRLLGHIDCLGPKVTFVLAHPPQGQATGQVFFVKFQIPGVARVAILAAPHLQGTLRVTDEHGGFASAPPRGDPVDRVWRSSRSYRPLYTAGLAQGCQLGKVVVVWRQRTAAYDGLAVSEKKLEPALSQELLSAAAQSPALLAVRPDWRDPLIA